MNPALPSIKDPNIFMYGFRGLICSYLDQESLDKSKAVSRIFYEAINLKDFNDFEKEALKKRFISYNSRYYLACFRDLQNFFIDQNIIANSLTEHSKSLAQSSGRMVNKKNPNLPSAKELNIIYRFRGLICSYLDQESLDKSKVVSKIFYEAANLKDVNDFEKEVLKKRFINYNRKYYLVCFRDLQNFFIDQNIVANSLTENSNNLSLPSGKVLSKSTFLEDPLFCNTKEKESVFAELRKLLKQESFLGEYEIFLSSRDKEDWFKQYEQNPIQLAYLSLLAFLDDQIDQEELFVVHTVATAYNELNSESSEKARVIKVEPKVILSAFNLPLLLPEFNIPPLENKKFSMISNSKSEEELRDLMADFLSRYKKRSMIKRTFVTYTIPDYTRRQIPISVESGIRFSTGSFAFSKDNRDGTGEIILPPLDLAWKLFCMTSKFEKRMKDPKPAFGHVNKANVLFKGRPVTCPSPLFGTKRPHSFSFGPAGLGMYFHDLYHLLLEANNPHVDLLIEIGKKLINKNRIASLGLDQKIFRKFGIEILDREVVPYKKGPCKEAFWGFIKLKISYVLMFEAVEKDRIIKYFKEMLLPIIQKSLEDYQEKEEIQELVPIMEYSDPEDLYEECFQSFRREGQNLIEKLALIS